MFVHMQIEEGWLRFFAVGFTCVLSVSVTSLFIGITKHERMLLLDKGLRLLRIKNDKS